MRAHDPREWREIAISDEELEELISDKKLSRRGRKKRPFNREDVSFTERDYDDEEEYYD